MEQAKKSRRGFASWPVEKRVKVASAGGVARAKKLTRKRILEISASGGNAKGRNYAAREEGTAA